MIFELRQLRKAWSCVCMLSLTLTKLAQAAPQGGQVVSGQAVIQTSTQAGKSVITVTQTSPKATLNWQTFNLSSSDTVRFVQPDASSLVVNRISDPNGSKISGKLSANGQVWLINPAGVYFGPGAQVNVGGLLASTLNLADNADPYKMQGPVLAGNNTASVINQGNIQTSSGGYVALLGTKVGNSGDINSPGGRILLLGDKLSGTVELNGRLDASGGPNQLTGFVETSAAQVRIADSASVYTHSADGSSGNWFIDPTNFTISSGSGAPTTSSIGAATLSNSLSSNNVSIATDNSSGSDSGNIYVNSAVSWTTANTLSLSAYKDIYINAPITSTSTGGVLKLLYGQGSSSGTISGVASDYYVNAPVSLGKGVNFYTQLGSDSANLKSYQVITGIGSHASTTGTDLQGINGALSGNYALGADIDASGTTSWYTKANYYGFTKIGDNDNLTGTETFFSGTFAGLGHTVSHLYMYQPNTGVSGMFAGLSTTGVIRDTGLVSMDITTNSSGGLVGRNRGSVKNSFSTGSITSNAGFVGGLVGDNSTGTGTVTDSYSTATVTVSNNANIPAGGLVGRNYHTITNSYASGSVSSSSSFTGGLVGDLKASGSISASVWNTTTSGQSNGYGSASTGSSSGVTGLSSSEMKLSANYSSWDFTTPWIIYSGYTAPLLRAFMTPLTINAYASGSKVYDGTTTTTAASYTDPGSLSKTFSGSISFALDGADVGTHSVVASGFYSDQLGYQISYSFSTNSVAVTSSASSATTSVPNITQTLTSLIPANHTSSTGEAVIVVANEPAESNNLAAASFTAKDDKPTQDQNNVSNAPALTDTSFEPASSADNPTSVLQQTASESPYAAESADPVTAQKQSHLTLPAINNNPPHRPIHADQTPPVDLNRTWNAEFSVNNAGSSYTGEVQTGLHQRHNRLFQNGDDLDLNLMVSSGQMQFGRLAYEWPVGTAGWRLGASGTHLAYKLGGSAASLNAFGHADQQSVWADQKLSGNEDYQWNWRTQYDSVALHDVEDTSGTNNDRLLQVWHLGTSVTRNDSLGPGHAWLNLDLLWSDLHFNDATAQATDAAAADTQGHASKIALSAGRLQPLSLHTQWILNWQAQWAQHNLDTTQKISLGGAHSVRAYAPGVLSGDNGHFLSNEIKHMLSPDNRALNARGDWYASVFMDAGWLTLYRNPYASGDNQARLIGVGAGLSWEGPDHWNASLSISQALGSAASQLSGSYLHANAWLAVSKGFR